MGIEKTFPKMNQRYRWPKIRRSVSPYVSTSSHCQLNKPLPGFRKKNQTDWDEHLPDAMLCITTSQQSSTKRTPLELIHGRTAVLPHQGCFSWPDAPSFSYRKFIRRLSKRRVAALQLIVSSQRKSKARYDRFHRHARPYRTGDLVLVARKA